MELLTVSRLKAYAACPFREYLRYQEGWREMEEGEALTFGSAAHEALEAWWLAPDGERLTSALAAILTKVKDKYQEEKLHAMIMHYDERWRAEADLFEVVGAEVQFNVPLLHPLDRRISHPHFNMAGKVDVIVRDKATGHVAIVEHKTTSDDVSDPTADYWLRLQQDWQISMYYWGASAATGLDVFGALYDVLRKPQVNPKMRTPEHKRKYTKAGKLYANQSLTDEGVTAYGFRVIAKLAEDPDNWYFRRWIPRTDHELVEFLEQLWKWANNMAAGDNPKNMDACAPRGSYRCPYYDHCVSKRPLEDFCTKHEDKHPELGS